MPRLPMPLLYAVLGALLALSAPASVQAQPQSDGAAQPTAANNADEDADEQDADESVDEEGEDEAGSGEAELETIKVTARRREESIQDVPMSVTAFSGDELRERGTQDITDLTKAVPNTTLEVTRGTNTTLSAFIRGVGQQDPVAGFESGVGIYLNGVYLNRPQAAVLDVYDVQSIEVLRGPQGTLYGRNTIGGAVKYVTERLSHEPEAELRVSLGSFSQTDVVVSGETPLSETFAVGASFASLRRSGFGENILKNRDHYNKETRAARFSAEWTPTPRAFFRLSLDALEDDSNPRAGHREIPGLASGAPVLDDVFDTRAGIDGDNKVEQYGATLNAEYDLTNRWTLKNIVAWRGDETEQRIDFEGLPARDLDVPVIYDNEQFSEELQLHYDGDLIQGVGGFYYLDASASNVFDVILATTGEVIGIPGLNAFSLGDVETSSWSLFSDVTLDLSGFMDLNQGLELSLGGRFTSDKRSSRVLRQTMTGGNSTFLGGDAVPVATTSDFEGAERFEDFTGRVSLAWKPIPTQNFYASFSQGFKGGSFDPRGQTTATPDFNGDGTISEQEVFEFMKFEPEKVDTYELGAKSIWGGGRATTNLAVFYSDYTDVQIPGSVGVDTDGDGVSDTFAGVTTNAGAATIKGLELEGNVTLATDIVTGSDALSSRFQVGWTDAEFDRFIAQVTDPATGSTALEDVADERVFQNTPEWTSQLRLRYDRPMSLFGVPGFFSIDGAWSYRSLTHQFETPSPFLDQEAYSLFDVNLIWSTADGKYEVGLHGRNLADKEYIVSGYQFVNNAGTVPTLGLEGVANTFFGDPRTITGTVKIRF